MSSEEEVQRRQLESMTTDQIRRRIQVSRGEFNIFIEQLITRATLQEYTEQQYNELLTLLQECLTYIEEVASPSLEWVGKRNELLVKLRRKI